ncbi:hypothetical protein [Erysipelothrix urinaevulpis]|uniref:hypothetical protein n=2 Tax=Erysipelothrix urinaevulpis TaxID=2683717 RepID=UPI00135B081F|nr:hypothetical protein [Erysipelothrix urinaevulpis]
MSMLLYILRKQHDYQQLKTSEFINTIMIQNIRNADELLATVSNQSLTHVQVDQEVDVEASQSYLTQSKGYSYFNNLFMNRHRRIWLKPLKILTFLVFSFACLLTGLLFYIQNIDPNAKAILGDGDVFESVYFLFTKAFLLFYYFTNIGEKITQAYYINADYSLLHYSFYRRKEVIWRQYLSRVKSSIYIGIVPVMTLTVFLIIWKVMVPSSSTLNLFSFIINLFIISMFFNLHYLFMYYLLSPFNLKLEAKSIPYNLSKIIIYLFVFNSSEFLAKPQSFIYMSVFFVLYTLCSIVLVRLFAHKTFTYKD